MRPGGVSIERATATQAPPKKVLAHPQRGGQRYEYQAGRKQDMSVAIDSITVKLDLTVDGARNSPVAVAPDIQFIPTVSYGQIITANRGSRLVLTLKNTGSGAHGGDCDVTAPAK